MYSNTGNGAVAAVLGVPMATQPQAQQPAPAQPLPAPHPLTHLVPVQNQAAPQPQFVQPAAQVAAAVQPVQVIAPAPAVQPAAPLQAAPVQLAATIPEIEAACPGAPAEFVLGQVKAGASVATAQTAFIGMMNTQLQQLTAPTAPVAVAPVGVAPQQFAPAPVAVAPVAPVAPGVAPQPMVGSVGVYQMPGIQPVVPEPGTDPNQFGGMPPAQLWADSIAAESQRLVQDAVIGGRTVDRHTLHQQAVFNVDAKNPGLRDAYLASCDSTPKQAPAAPRS